jgi:DNA-binding NarL/FixJ family response regulator
MLSGDISGNCLLVSPTTSNTEKIQQAMHNFAIAAESCDDPEVAVRLIRSRKYEAVVIDFEFGKVARDILREVRSSASNRRSVVFALVEHDSEASEAFVSGSSFTLSKPVIEEKAVRLIRAAYGMILRERRRYFRCPVSIPATLTLPKLPPQEAQVVNLSEGGLSLQCSSPITGHPPVFVEFTLPDNGARISCQASICWTNSQGRCGLQIESVAPDAKRHLEKWLGQKLDEFIPPAVTANLEHPSLQIQ